VCGRLFRGGSEGRGNVIGGREARGVSVGGLNTELTQLDAEPLFALH